MNKVPLTTNLRVLIVEPAGGLWGSERALLDLIEAASNLNIAVCCPPNTPLVAELLRRRVKVFPWFIERLHEKSRASRAQAAAGVLRACMAFHPDVIHLNQSGAWRVTLPASTLMNLPVVCHVRIFEDAEYLASCRPSPRRMRAIIAISGAVEATIRDFPALDAIPVHRIYDAYTCASSAPDSPRLQNRIICVGRLTPIKAQDLLVAAMAPTLLAPEIECVIIGEGPSHFVGPLKAASPSGVHWRGYISDVIGEIRRSRVLACPSHREPLGRVILEAWDAGAVPVVFKGSGGAAEIVAAANGGVIYDEQSPAVLAEGIARAIMLEQREFDRMIANGRAWIMANCSPKEYGRQISKILAETTL